MSNLPVWAWDASRTLEGTIMSIGVKGRERPGVVLAAGIFLSSLGVVMAALVCCGLPVLTGAAGVFAAAGAMAGNLWFITPAALTAGALLLPGLHRASPGSNCCARPVASLPAGGSTPTRHSSPEQARSGLSRPGVRAAKDAGSKA